MIRLDGKYWPFESADSTCQTYGDGEKASRLSAIARSARVRRLFRWKHMPIGDLYPCELNFPESASLKSAIPTPSDSGTRTDAVATGCMYCCDWEPSVGTT